MDRNYQSKDEESPELGACSLALGCFQKAIDATNPGKIASRAKAPVFSHSFSPVFSYHL